MRHHVGGVSIAQPWLTIIRTVWVVLALAFLAVSNPVQRQPIKWVVLGMTVQPEYAALWLLRAEKESYQ